MESDLELYLTLKFTLLSNYDRLFWRTPPTVQRVVLNTKRKVHKKKRTFRRWIGPWNKWLWETQIHTGTLMKTVTLTLVFTEKVRFYSVTRKTRSQGERDELKFSGIQGIPTSRCSFFRLRNVVGYFFSVGVSSSCKWLDNVLVLYFKITQVKPQIMSSFVMGLITC